MRSPLSFWTMIGLLLASSIPYALGTTTVTVTATVNTASEQGPSPGVFKFTRSGDLLSSLTVDFTLSGSAITGTDYLIWENNAQFDAGADTAFVTVLPVNDALQEGNETIILALSPSSGYTIGSPNSATITVVDYFVPGFPGVFMGINPNLTREITYLETTIANGQLWIRVGLKTPSFSHVQIWLDTDHNPTTGDFRHGYIGSAEYRIWAFVTAGIFADYNLTQLPKSLADCQSVECETTIAISVPASINGNLLTLAVPLSLIGNPTAVDVFATTYEGSNAYGIAGNGARAPAYGVLDTATGRVIVRRPGKTQRRTFTDAVGDTSGIGYDLKQAEFLSVADQFLMGLQFSQVYDPTQPQFGPGPRGFVTLDSDRKLLTGNIFMGNQIPTWGGDGVLYFDLTTSVPLFQYFFDPTGSGSVLFATEHNDGRWLVNGNTVTISGSLSIYDAFLKTSTSSTRSATDGRMLASVASLEVGASLVDARIIDQIPAQSSALDIATGQVLPPLMWDPSRTLSQTDPAELGPISGLDLIRIDAEVLDNKLVIKSVLSTWLNTDVDNFYEILLDVDMNSATGFPWHSNNGGQTIGVDLVVQIASIDGVAPFYLANLVFPSGLSTTQDAMLLAQPSVSAALPGSFTITLPLTELAPMVPFGPQLRFYVTTGQLGGAGRIDTAPPQPMVITLMQAPTNQAPVVNAGPDQTITLPTQAALHGTATDDGLPNPPGALTTTWSKFSGPGTVTFSNAAALDTTTSFSQAGTYILRLTANDGALAAADDLTITVQPPVQNPTLTATPTSVLPGGAVTATWVDIATPTATDWLGLYVPGSTDAAYLAWRYTTGTASGTVPFAIPGTIPPGTYELRLFSNNGYTRLATSNAFTVTPGGGPVTLSASPTSVPAGGSVTATWAGMASPSATDWLGLYAPGSADTAYLAWRYTTGAAGGNVPFGIPGTLAAGTYELRLFSNNGYTRLAISNSFTVTSSGPSPTLSVSPTSVPTGGSVTATWANIAAPSATDWLGLYAPGSADAAYLAWRYTTGTPSGNVPFTIPGTLAAGTYELRLFSNNGYTRLATSNAFTVTAPLGAVVPDRVATDDQ